MVQYKLYYFNSRGAGETARLILNYAKVNFGDVRLERDDWAKNYKSKMPFGQVPVLEVDGKKLAQSFAIYRYLARKYGLVGKDEFEQAQVDSLADYFKDFLQEVLPFLMVLLGYTEGNKDALKKEKFDPAKEKYFKTFKKYLKDAGNGFLFKSGLTWVDFYASEMFDTLNNFMPEFFKENPEFKKHSEKVKAVAQLEKYFKTRPATKN